MLILSRRLNEVIVIRSGDMTIEVTLLSLQGNQARIGIDAPKSIEIHRKEVAARIDAGEPRKPAKAIGARS